MDDAPAAIGACYADFKLIRTRGVVQLIFEVPVEQASHVLEVMGGMPDNDKSSWFAIAKMNKAEK